jgi:hypothetical protein
MDRYLVFRIADSVKAKESGRVFDIVNAVAVDLVVGSGTDYIAWFLDPGMAVSLFPDGCGVYGIRTLASGRGTKPVQAAYMGMPVWPDEATGGPRIVEQEQAAW